MPHDLDETRMADAVRAFCGDNRGKPCSYPECRCEGYKQRIPAAIAAWEASAPKREPATEEQITGAWVRFCRHVESQSQAFHAGARWAESRPPRAEPKPEPPRSSMTKAQLAGLLAILDGDSSSNHLMRLANAIRAETPDA